MGNNDPDAKLGWLERCSGWATIMILLGIALEIAVLWWKPPFWSERVWSTTADGLIGVGLAVEYIVIRLTIVAVGESKELANQKVSESNRLAREAQARASEAELALIEFRKPRSEQLLGQTGWKAKAVRRHPIRYRP